jgi:hypothetical protein
MLPHPMKLHRLDLHIFASTSTTFNSDIPAQDTRMTMAAPELFFHNFVLVFPCQQISKRPRRFARIWQFGSLICLFGGGDFGN